MNEALLKYYFIWVNFMDILQSSKFLLLIKIFQSEASVPQMFLYRFKICRPFEKNFQNILRRKKNTVHVNMLQVYI